MQETTKICGNTNWGVEIYMTDNFTKLQDEKSETRVKVPAFVDEGI